VVPDVQQRWVMHRLSTTWACCSQGDGVVKDAEHGRGRGLAAQQILAMLSAPAISFRNPVHVRVTSLIGQISQL